MTTTFIYLLRDPENTNKGYVGKSNTPKRRFRDHLRERREHYRGFWIRSLAVKGLSPVLEILDEVSVTEWQQWEAAWIEFFREQGFELTNTAPGGEGGCRGLISDETRSKMRNNWAARREKNPNLGKSPFLGRKHTSETLEKMRASAKRRGNCNPMCGETFIPEHREKISAGLRRRWGNI